MADSDPPPSARGAPEWRAVKGEPDWVFARYKASAWPHFIRRLFDWHKLQPNDQRFAENETETKPSVRRRPHRRSFKSA